MYFDIYFGCTMVINNARYGHAWRHEELSSINWQSRQDAEKACNDMHEATGYRYWIEEE